MSMFHSYTSTGSKILHHPDAIRDLRAGRKHPIVLHVMPTEKCNLRCEFCSVAGRGDRELAMGAIAYTIKTLHRIGLKAVIISGGGEPLLYPGINGLIAFCSAYGLEVGLITNGTLLASHLEAESLSVLTWLRISMNSLDYLNYLVIPGLPKTVTLGFSYIWHRGTEPMVLRAIRDKVRQYSPAYVRLLPDCNLPEAEFNMISNEIDEFAASAGAPFFNQDKRPEQAQCCYLGAVHPVLYADEMIYPCDSLVLNGDGYFNPSYALCHYSDIEAFYSKPIDGSLMDVSKCPRCVFTRNNALLETIMHGDELPKAQDVRHENFI
jgi:hypothetical protein